MLNHASKKIENLKEVKFNGLFKTLTWLENINQSMTSKPKGVDYHMTEDDLSLVNMEPRKGTNKGISDRKPQDTTSNTITYGEDNSSSERNTYTVEVSQNPDYLIDQTWEFDAITGNSFFPLLPHESPTNEHHKANNGQTLYTRPSIPSSLSIQSRPNSSANTRVDDSRVSYHYKLLTKNETLGNGMKKSYIQSRQESDGHLNEIRNDSVVKTTSHQPRENLTPKAKLQRRKSYDPKQSIGGPQKREKSIDIVPNRNMTSSAIHNSRFTHDQNNNHTSITITSLNSAVHSNLEQTSQSKRSSSFYSETKGSASRSNSKNRNTVYSTIASHSKNTVTSLRKASDIPNCTYPDSLVDELLKKIEVIRKVLLLLKDMIRNDYTNNDSSCDGGDDIFCDEDLQIIHNDIQNNKPMFKAFKDIRMLEGALQDIYSMITPENESIFDSLASIMRPSVNYKDPRNFEYLKSKAFEKILQKENLSSIKKDI